MRNFKIKLFSFVLLAIFCSQIAFNLHAIAVEDPFSVDFIPNNRRQAMLLELIENEDGNLVGSFESFLENKKDKDFFKFLVPEDGMILHLTSDTPQFVKFYQGKKRLPKKRDAENNIVVKLKAKGEYFVRVSRKPTLKFSPTAYGFQITLFKKPVVDDSSSNTDGNSDSDDDSSTVDENSNTGIKKIPIGKIVQNELSAENPEFIYEFTVVEGNEGYYDIELLSYDFTDPNADTSKNLSHADLTLLDASGKELATDFNGLREKDYTLGTRRKIYENLSAGKYRVKVDAKTALYGVFRLVVRAPDGIANGVVNAPVLDLNGFSQDGKIDYPGDVDYFRVGKLSPGRYKVHLDHNIKNNYLVIAHRDVSTKLFVLDAFPPILSEFLITYSFSVFDFQNPDNEYFVIVGSSSITIDSSTGAYTIRLSN